MRTEGALVVDFFVAGFFFVTVVVAGMAAEASSLAHDLQPPLPTSLAMKSRATAGGGMI